MCLVNQLISLASSTFLCLFEVVFEPILCFFLSSFHPQHFNIISYLLLLNLVFHERTIHIEIDFHFILVMILSRVITTLFDNLN